MSRSRDRQKKCEREAWVKRSAERHRQAITRAMFPLVNCDECHGSGRAADWRKLGSHGPIGLGGRYEMCRKCGGDGKVRAGMIRINVTI